MYQRRFYQLITAILLLTIGLQPLVVVAKPLGENTIDESDNALFHTTRNGETTIIINEVLFYPQPDQYEWVELRNTGDTIANLNGFSLTDEDGHWYRFPHDLPVVPAGGFVVVIFDGLGSAYDDYDFTDNVATLHSTLVNVFEDDADQCALYSYGYFIYLPLILKNTSSTVVNAPTSFTSILSSSIADFVAWGAVPQEDAHNASVAGAWPEALFVNTYRGLGEASPDLVLQPGESIGLLPGSLLHHPDYWTLYQTSEVTEGAVNALPNISWFYPSAGATIDSETFTISWNALFGATGYRFQLDDVADFTSPVTDTVLGTPAYMPTAGILEGTYYWRVKTIFPDGESNWTSGVEIHSLTIPNISFNSPSATSASKTLGITWQLQHKDTNMLCLDGDNETGDFAWDAPHVDRGAHGNKYCVRASVSMIASYYGGTLSQDRISYEIFKDFFPGPEFDLGHDIGVAPPPDPAETDILSWALGQPVLLHTGKPDFQEIKNWIDADQPIMSRIRGHMRVIDGYTEFTLSTVEFQFIHLLDPWDRAKWVSYEDDETTHAWVGPSGAGNAPDVLSDEDEDNDGNADTTDDSDGDGICDFDEKYRFFLDLSVADSDNDLVPDKLDIREYVFDVTGVYHWRNPDIDDDQKRKEIDPDNDSFWDVTAWDGYEDMNRNGRFEPGLDETNTFNVTDDRVPQIDITAPVYGHDNGYSCLITLEGTIHSETALTSATLSSQGHNDYTLAPNGTLPDYTFRQTDVTLFAGATQIMVTAANQYGVGRDYVIVYANCE